MAIWCQTSAAAAAAGLVLWWMGTQQYLGNARVQRIRGQRLCGYVDAQLCIAAKSARGANEGWGLESETQREME